MSITLDFLMANFRVIHESEQYQYIGNRPRIVCADGFSFSAQASFSHYCSPRETLETCEYSEIEIGYPSERVDEWMPFAEKESDPTQTVYGWVPVELVDAVIEKHGGLHD